MGRKSQLLLILSSSQIPPQIRIKFNPEQARTITWAFNFIKYSSKFTIIFQASCLLNCESACSLARLWQGQKNNQPDGKQHC